jgi:energy-coupling factor transporter ATP-binding protein EcfA2
MQYTMSSSKYRRPSDLPPSTRPPSYTNEIPISRTSKSDALKTASQHRGSISTGTSRDLPKKPLLSSPHEHEEPDPEDTQPKVCENCECEKTPIWNCSYCDMNFCDQCWGKQGPHKAGRTGPDGLPHEKANPTIVRRLKDILTPPKDPGQQQNLHIEDEDTTWFGLGRDNPSRPVFQDYGRYSAIMADSNSGEYKFRYPQLVSFIGQTGAGKSTLIKMLIDQQERKLRPRDWGFPSPIAGSGNIPTSGDVHLYSDPSTYVAEYPMLYADCEGLEGGENTPMAAQYRNSGPISPKEKGKDNNVPKEHRKRRKVAKGLHCTQREIKWPDSSPGTLKRQYAVTELYPRLLYTFSDVIVFVLRNAKYVYLSFNIAFTCAERTYRKL